MKPMLSATFTPGVHQVRFPVLISPKLDGIRCIIDAGGRPLSRNFKEIPNASIRQTLSDLGLPALDGELVVGSATSPDCYRTTNSGVMSRDGEPDWCFYVFDVLTGTGRPFKERIRMAKKAVQDARHKRIKIVPHVMVENEDTLIRHEQQFLREGFEGVMGRDPEGPYKFGRATMKEGWLWKLKRFTDGEAIITGFAEQMHNGNEATEDELGRTKRSSHKAGKAGKNTLGALAVRDVRTGVEFDIGTGFTDAERDAIWAGRVDWLSRIVKYKSFPQGVKDRPRFPVFMGLRQDI